MRLLGRETHRDAPRIFPLPALFVVRDRNDRGSAKNKNGGRTMRSRIASLLAALFLASSVLMGCGGGGGEEQQQEEQQQEDGGGEQEDEE